MNLIKNYASFFVLFLKKFICLVIHFYCILQKPATDSLRSTDLGSFVLGESMVIPLEGFVVQAKNKFMGGLVGVEIQLCRGVLPKACTLARASIFLSVCYFIGSGD